MELATEYKDVENLYKRQFVMVKTERMAHEDLDKYGKALDAAIVKFHGLKLKEINDIIKELWVKTYRGNGRIYF
jgi:DNA repair protein RAD50